MRGHNSGNIIQYTKLYTLNGLILWCTNYILIKLLKMPGLQSGMQQGSILTSRGHSRMCRHIVVTTNNYAATNVNNRVWETLVWRRCFIETSFFTLLLSYIYFCIFHRVMVLVLTMITCSTFFFNSPNFKLFLCVNILYYL